MAGYSFFPAADKAQDKIWKYTAETWGEKQAEKYILGLHAHLQRLADKQLFWRSLPDSLVVSPDLEIHAYISRYEHHYIFFRALPDNQIGIMSILHERTDMPVNLARDLKVILGE